MLWIRQCEDCGHRIRTIGRAAQRVFRCPYCNAKVSVGEEPQFALRPTAVERLAWTLGVLTEILGVALAGFLVFQHERFSMSWLGATLVASIVFVLVVATGRVSRIGSRREHIGRNVIALVLLYSLSLYGFFAFPALDALGGSCMVLFAVFCAIVGDELEGNSSLTQRIEQAQFWSWILLLAFLVAYVIHAIQPLLKR